jgi:hypothetical protein
MEILQENYLNMFNIETVDNLDKTNDLREAMKSDKEIQYSNKEIQYSDFGDNQDEQKLPKTAYPQNRQGMHNAFAVTNMQYPKSDMDNLSFKGQPLNLLSKTVHDHKGIFDGQITSEGSQAGEEIYLNKNSAEENPDNLDDNIKDSKSLSKHTLNFNETQDERIEGDEDLVKEGETDMSQKESIHQIQPDDLTEIESEGKTFVRSPTKIEPEFEDYSEPENEKSLAHPDEKTIMYNRSEISNMQTISPSVKYRQKYIDKNLQITPNDISKKNIKKKQQESKNGKSEDEKTKKIGSKASDSSKTASQKSKSKAGESKIEDKKFNDNRSEHISKEIAKLANSAGRREKAKSSKDVPKVPKNIKKEESKGKANTRYSRSNPFNYEDVSHPDINRDIHRDLNKSEERKMPPPTPEEVKQRSRTGDLTIAQPETEINCLDIYPPSTPSAYSVAIQANENWNKSQGIQARESTISNQMQVNMYQTDQKNQANPNEQFVQ